MLTLGDKLYRYSHHDHKLNIYTFLWARETKPHIWLLKADIDGTDFYYNSLDPHPYFYTKEEAIEKALRFLRSRVPIARQNLEADQKGLDSLNSEIAKLENQLEWSGQNTVIKSDRILLDNALKYAIL
jgi:hypothetical protein